MEGSALFGSKTSLVSEILQFPVIVCLGRKAEEAIKRTRNMYFPNIPEWEWDHYFLPHLRSINNTSEEYFKALGQLNAAYKKLLTLRVYETKVVL